MARLWHLLAAIIAGDSPSGYTPCTCSETISGLERMRTIEPVAGYGDNIDAMAT